MGGKKNGSLEHSERTARDSDGGRGGGGLRDDESALKVKLDSLGVVMGEG